MQNAFDLWFILDFFPQHYECLLIQMRVMLLAGFVTDDTIQVLWDVFAQRVPHTTSQQSRAALTILGMAGLARPEIIKTNLSLLVSIGLGKSDFS